VGEGGPGWRGLVEDVEPVAGRRGRGGDEDCVAFGELMMQTLTFEMRTDDGEGDEFGVGRHATTVWEIRG
jgi:hypothetical protein